MMRVLVLTTFVVAQSTGGCLSSLKDAIPTGTSGEPAMEAFSGDWGSIAASAASNACTDFSWRVTDVTITGATGEWSARCLTAIPVNGTATASVVDGEVRWTATGAGTIEGASCPVALAGASGLANGQLRISYSGTTCLGQVSGTEILRK